MTQNIQPKQTRILLKQRSGIFLPYKEIWNISYSFVTTPNSLGTHFNEIKISSS